MEKKNVFARPTLDRFLTSSQSEHDEKLQKERETKKNQFAGNRANALYL